jgi:hypothetical protein
MFVLAGCATPPEVSEPVPGAVVSLPLDIGKLQLTRSYVYPEARLGTFYGYAGEFALYPDVYVYPNPFPGNLPSPAGAESAERAAESFRDEIAYAVEQGAYESAEVLEVSEFVHDWKYGHLDGRRVSLTIVRDGQELVSRAYFFAVHDLLVKVRVSHFDYPGLMDNMDWFVGELLDGTRVVHYDEEGVPVIGIDSEHDLKQQLVSRLNDFQVVRAREEIMERAVSETRDGTVYYGRFEQREPITGPIEGKAPDAEAR